jgi:hypothetical protein
MKYIFFIVGLFFLITVSPLHTLAHQPRIVTETPVIVTEPEVSKAYYSTLLEKPQVYLIQASESFDLYVNILVPDTATQKKDVSAVITKDGQQIAVLEGTQFEWKKYFEKFGHDNYWMGPEYRARVEKGEYQIAVWSSNNDSKYALAIGEIEAFGFKEGIASLSIIPQLKKDFFNKSPIDFILSPFGYGEIIILFILAALFGLLYRALLKHFVKNTKYTAPQNIGTSDKFLRVTIGIILLVWAITTSWSPILIFFSGFCFFEAAFSWCGFYAAIGKNTCPM